LHRSCAVRQTANNWLLKPKSKIFCRPFSHFHIFTIKALTIIKSCQNPLNVLDLPPPPQNIMLFYSIHGEIAMSHTKHITLAVMASATLAACGGGGTSTPDAAATAATPYVGTWKTACDQGMARVDSAGSAYLKGYRTIVVTASSANTLVFNMVDKDFATTDTACSGAVIATIESSATVTIDAAATIGGQTVDKMTYVNAGASKLVSGNVTMTSGFPSVLTQINGYYYIAGTFRADPAQKGLIRVNSNQMFLDDGTGTASVYPTGMDPLAYATKI
jgi:hypothetical protein